MENIIERDTSTRVRPSFNTWLICAVCFLVIAVDGFDTAAIAYVAPTLTQIWHLPHAAMTAAFIATSVGAVVGYLASGVCAHLATRRMVMVIAMLAFGGLSLLTTISTGIPSISTMRFLTTICLGIVIPIAISLAADNASDDARASVTIAATTGLSVGAALGGFASVKLIGAFGWQSVFIVGGIAPVLLLPLVWFVLPRNRASTRNTDGAHCDGTRSSWFTEVGRLFAPERLWETLTVWFVAFFGFLVTYLFVFWTPMLLLSSGFSASSAPIGAAANALGGIVGSIVLIVLVKRLGVQRSLIISAAIAVVCTVGFQIKGLERWLVLLLIFGVGVGTTSACVGQATLAAILYPASLRTTGIGYGAAVGRVGAIMGPSAGGLLIALGVSAQRIVLLSSIPLAIIMIVLLFSQMRLLTKTKTLEAGTF